MAADQQEHSALGNVRFGEAVIRRSRAQIGIPATPDECSFSTTTPSPHREACDMSRRATSSWGDIVPGDRRGPLPLRWVRAAHDGDFLHPVVAARAARRRTVHRRHSFSARPRMSSASLARSGPPHDR
jgi:hypothetical protein